MPLHQGHSSTPRWSFSRPNAGEYGWLTHTGQLKRERQLLRSSCEAYRTPHVQAPPLLRSFPTTAAPALLTESWKLLPSSRASPAGKNQHWRHSQSHQGAEIRGKQWETVKLYAALLQHHCLRLAKKEPQAREGRKPGCNRQGWVYAASRASGGSKHCLSACHEFPWYYSI